MATKQKNLTEKKDLPLLYMKDFKLPHNPAEHENAHVATLGDGWVIAFTGIRGSGKSLSLAMTIAKAMALGIPVWSNMSVAFRCVHGPGNVKSYASKPLDFNALYTLSGELQHGAVAIDELQYYTDSRTSLTLRNRLLNAVIRQIRKRSLDFYYTTRDLSWLDKRLRFWETDMEIQCWDLSKGNNNIEKGKYIRWNIYDLSGSLTGRPWQDWMREPTHKYNIVGADRIWPIYSTEEIIDYFDAMTPMRLDLGQRVLSNRQNESEVRLGSLQALAIDLKGQGVKEVPADQFCAMAQKYYGVPAEPKVVGKDVVKLGITKHRTRAGTFYNLSLLAGENGHDTS